MTARKTCPTCGTGYEPHERFCPRDGSALRTQGGGTDLVGQVIADRYHVLRKLGEGGMGQVYLAEHVKMGRRSAVKVMRPGMAHDADAISRFNREAANASRINHPHVAAIYDFGETPEGVIYLAMEFVDGEPLTALLEREGALAPARVGALVRQTADALGAAHDMGIVHRDLKPDNIMIGRARDGADAVKVVDFGIAKAGAEVGQQVTRTGLVVGTPEYMSPEQLSGDRLDGRSDVYALGLVAFHALTGALPFPSETAQESMIMRLTDRPRTLAEMRPGVAWPAALQAAMDRALERDVARRYPDGPAFARDFVLAVADMPAIAAPDDRTHVLGAVPYLPPTHAARADATRVLAGATRGVAGTPVPRRRRTAVLAAAGIAMVGAVGLGAWALKGRESPAAAPPSGAPSIAGRSSDSASDPAPVERYGRPLQAAATPGAAAAPEPTGRRRAVPGTVGTSETTALPKAAPAEVDEYVTDEATLLTRVALITEANAHGWLRRSDAALQRGAALSPRRRMSAMFFRAAALQTLGRQTEGCAELQRIRDGYRIMSPGFRHDVDTFFDPESGSCQ